MAYEFARATFHVSGDVASDVLRQSLTVLECKYNVSALLHIERDEWRWRYLTFELEQLLELLYRPRLTPTTRSDRGPSMGQQIGPITDFISANLIEDESLKLRVIAVTPSGSLNIDTSGLGEPLKQVVKKVLTRKERAEARRHTEEMHWRKERDSDQRYRHKEQQHQLDSLLKISELQRSGTISPDIAEALLSQLLPIEATANREIDNSRIDYVDDSLEEHPE